MEENNKKETNVVTVQTKKSVLVTPKVEVYEDNDVEHSIEEYMTHNKANTKISINWESVAVVFMIILVVGICGFFIIRFLDSYEKDKEKMRVATSTTTMTTTTTTTEAIRYETTTTVATQATHTVFVKR